MAQKINSDVMKQNNRREILRLVRKEPCSRIKLAEKTSLTRAAISFICEELIAEGLLVEGEKQVSIGGRPATLLHLNSSYGVFGGVHFSREEYAVGVCDFAGRVKREKRGIVVPSDCLGTLKRIKTDLNELLEGEKNLLGIGISAPGPLDKKAGILRDIANFSSWRNFPIVEFFKSEFGCDCVLDNYSNALAYAECVMNEKCQRRYLELIIDSGFGSSVAIRKNGVSLIECELGHTCVNMFGEKCDCGNVGCSELYVNEKKFLGSNEDLENFYSALSSVIVNSVNTFAVKQIIFVGCVTNYFERFAERICVELEQRRVKDVEILKTSLDGEEVFVACNLIIATKKL